MSTEVTFSIIKPNAMKKNVIGKIVDKFESNGLKIAGMKIMNISKGVDYNQVNILIFDFFNTFPTSTHDWRAFLAII